MTLATGTTLYNRYRIVKLVGQGGFGAVYRGWDTALNRAVAVKENIDTGPESQRQFEREAQLLANLRHPNLPVVIDHFILPGQGQYLVMDFVEGKSLDMLLAERGGPLGETEVLPWMRQVCDALDYLHNQMPSIIHRDIKPANILITARGQAMLVDFGISKLYDPSKGTTIGAKAVTPGYSPPEQYGRGRTDPRSDVYSLGATLYTLLTGQVPPEAPDLSSGADVLAPPRQVNPAVSEITSQAIEAAMVTSISQRLTSAANFAGALSSTAPPRPIMPLSAVSTTVPVAKERAGGSNARRGVPIWGWLVGSVALVVLATWAAMVFNERNGGVNRQEATAALAMTTAPAIVSNEPTRTTEPTRAAETSQPTVLATGRAIATDTVTPTIQPTAEPTGTPTITLTTESQVGDVSQNRLDASPTSAPATAVPVSTARSRSQITLIEPASCLQPRNFRDIGSIPFQWHYDAPLGLNEYLEVRIEPNLGIASQGRVTTSTDGAYSQDVSVSNFDVGAGSYRWQVVHMASDGKAELASSDYGCFTIGLPKPEPTDDTESGVATDIPKP